MAADGDFYVAVDRAEVSRERAIARVTVIAITPQATNIRAISPIADPDELAPDGATPDPEPPEPPEATTSPNTVPTASAAIPPTISAIFVASWSRVGTRGGGIGWPAAS
jgi:hypothetical protein